MKEPPVFSDFTKIESNLAKLSIHKGLKSCQKEHSFHKSKDKKQENSFSMSPNCAVAIYFPLVFYVFSCVHYGNTGCGVFKRGKQN